MIKNQYLQIAFATFLIGNVPAFADLQLQNEEKILNNKNYSQANCNLNKAAENCLNFKNIINQDKLDQYIFITTYSTKFVP